MDFPVYKFVRITVTLANGEKYHHTERIETDGADSSIQAEVDRIAKESFPKGFSSATWRLSK